MQQVSLTLSTKLFIYFFGIAYVFSEYGRQTLPEAGNMIKLQYV